MNCFWPATSRTSCLNPRTIFQTCHKFDSLAARFAQPSIRTFTVNSVRLLPVRRRDSFQLDTRPLSRKCLEPTPRIQNAIRTFASEQIITKFQRLPRDYEDEDGLAFRTKPLSAEEAHVIFGKIIDAGSANRLLRILHGRRVAGTLEDPNVPSLVSAYVAQANDIGLAWLRKSVPVDEVENAGLRAEKELVEMEAEIVSDAERLGLYKPNSGGSHSDVEKEPNVYGDSGLDAIRKAREKKLDDEAAENRISQADEIRHNTGILEKTNGRSNFALREPGANPRLKYYLERANILPNTPPEMTKFARLWPSGLVVLAVVIGALVFTQVYTPPKNLARIFPDMPPSAATVLSLILANSLVLVAWRVPALFRTLNKYFITVPGYPYPLSLIGNTFSHQTVAHFVGNMLVLWFVGTRLHDEVGRANFLAIYMACGALGSFASLTSWVLKSNFVSSSLGASGALYGIVSCYLWLNSGERLTLFGVFPPDNWPSLSATGFLVIMVGLEVLGMYGLGRVGGAPRIDHWAHLGGFGTGIVAAELLKVKVKRRKEAEMERRKTLGILDRIKEGRL